MHGAVTLGQDPHEILERHSVHTVGIDTTRPFIAGYHRDEHRIRSTGTDEDLCDNVFDTYFTANEAVEVGSSVQKVMLDFWGKYLCDL